MVLQTPSTGRGRRSSYQHSVTGHYAGPVSRAAAATLDVLVVMTVYTVGYAAAEVLVDAFLDVPFDGRWSGALAAVALSSWGFLYYLVAHAVAGRTVGKGVVGLRVLGASGSTLTVRQALVRTVALPLSCVLAIGLVPIVLHRQHRALHDFIAGTVVVYDWGARSARLPGPLSDFLASREVTTAAGQTVQQSGD